MVCHSPLQLQLFNLPSTNAEDEERVFNFLKTISTTTSNNRPEEVLVNAFVRIQVREDYNDQRLKSKRRKMKSSQQAEEEYVKMKNTLSIIKKLQKKFKLVLS